MTNSERKFDVKALTAAMAETTRKQMAARIHVSRQLLAYYLREPATMHKAKQLARALSTKERRLKPEDLIAS